MAEIIPFPKMRFELTGPVCASPGSDGSSAIILPFKGTERACAADSGPAEAVVSSAPPLLSGDNFRLCGEAEQKRMLSRFFGVDEDSGG